MCLNVCSLLLFQPIPVEKRTAIALWRLATGCGYRTLQELFGIGMSTACTIFHEFVTAVYVALGPQYLTRPSGDEFVRIVQGFQNKTGFPQCGGAIDGTHIPIIARRTNGMTITIGRDGTRW